MTKHDKNLIPNPGSPAAIYVGCTCAVLDNEHGNDELVYHDDNGQPCFWVNEDCPLHGHQEQ